MEVCDEPLKCSHSHKICETEPEVLEDVSDFTSRFNSAKDFALLQAMVEEGTSNNSELARQFGMPKSTVRKKKDTLRELGLKTEQISQIQWSNLLDDSLQFRGDQAAALYLTEPAVGPVQIEKGSEISREVAEDAARKSEVAEGVWGAGYFLSEEAHDQYRLLDSLVSVLQTSESSSDIEGLPSDDYLESLIDESQHINDLNDDKLPQTYFVSTYENKGDYLWLNDCAMRVSSGPPPQSESGYLLVEETDRYESGVQCAEIVRGLEEEEETLDDLC